MSDRRFNGAAAQKMERYYSSQRRICAWTAEWDMPGIVRLSIHTLWSNHQHHAVRLRPNVRATLHLPSKYVLNRALLRLLRLHCK
jgi:hypothetical protein